MPLAKSSRQKHAPKHRQGRRTRRSAATSAARSTVMLSSVAVAATGVPVLGGLLESSSPSSPVAADVRTTHVDSGLTEAELEDRGEIVSRSDSRDRRDAGKHASLSQAGGPAVTRREDLSEAAPREIGRALLPEYGFSADQWSCLDALFISESDWRVHADNPTSSAYGIPQALTSMHDLPRGYFTSAEVQIRWGLKYIRQSYGTPCSAWAFKQANSWY